MTRKSYILDSTLLLAYIRTYNNSFAIKGKKIESMNAKFMNENEFKYVETVLFMNFEIVVRVMDDSCDG